MRVLLSILLLLSALITLLVIGAGSHGDISMQNKETAFLVYSAILFFVTAISNGFYAQWKYSKILRVSSLVLNSVSVIILSIYLIEMFNLPLGKKIELIIFTILLIVQIIIIVILVIPEFFNKKRNQEVKYPRSNSKS